MHLMHVYRKENKKRKQNEFQYSNWVPHHKTGTVKFPQI